MDKSQKLVSSRRPTPAGQRALPTNLSIPLLSSFTGQQSTAALAGQALGRVEPPPAFREPFSRVVDNTRRFFDRNDLTMEEKMKFWILMVVDRFDVSLSPFLFAVNLPDAYLTRLQHFKRWHRHLLARTFLLYGLRYLLNDLYLRQFIIYSLSFFEPGAVLFLLARRINPFARPRRFMPSIARLDYSPGIYWKWVVAGASNGNRFIELHRGVLRVVAQQLDQGRIIVRCGDYV